MKLPFTPAGLLFDLDGTLLDYQGRIKAGIIEVLSLLREKGMRVGIATGRQYVRVYEDVLPHFLPEDKHVISGGAEMIKNDGEVIWGRYLPSDLVKNLFIELDQAGAELFFGQGKIAYLNAGKFSRVSPQTRALTRNPIEIGLTDWRTPLLVVDNLNAEVEAIMQKFIDEGLVGEVLIKKMTHVAGDSVSASNYYYDITPWGINKDTGAEVWAKDWGIDLGKTVMFGDNANDTEVLQRVGWGVVVASGTEEAKAVADEVIPSVDEGGLEAYLREML